jgi:hypothetical protein
LNEENVHFYGNRPDPGRIKILALCASLRAHSPNLESLRISTELGPVEI